MVWPMFLSLGRVIPGRNTLASGVVYVGSHGGHGERLIEAMRRCVSCCGIGKFWRVVYDQGPLLRDVFDRIAKEHLGAGI